MADIKESLLREAFANCDRLEEAIADAVELMPTDGQPIAAFRRVASHWLDTVRTIRAQVREGAGLGVTLTNVQSILREKFSHNEPSE